MVLDTVITSGLTALSLIDDTAGFTDLANPMAVEEYMRSRIAGRQEDARHARVMYPGDMRTNPCPDVHDCLTYAQCDIDR